MIIHPILQNNSNFYIAGRTQRVLNVKDFGASGNGTHDDTSAIQSCIVLLEALGGGSVYFPIGVYRITRGLWVDGQNCSIKFFGDSGIQTIVAGGLYKETTSRIEYDGPDNAQILTFDSGQGSSVERIALSTKSTSQYEIQIPGVEGIRFINKAICRNHHIDMCGFYRLEKGIHYFDDETNASSDLNMDGHSVSRSVFDTCENAIVVDQTNVYDTTFDKCQFFGTGNNMLHAVHVKKGHVYVTNSHVSKLKDATTSGGANGVAFYCEVGVLNMQNVYSEGHNAPLYHWLATTPPMMSARLDNVISANNSATIPTPWNVRNSSEQDLIITGGFLQNVQADAGSAGKIYAYGCGPNQLYNSIDELNDPARILRWN